MASRQTRVIGGNLTATQSFTLDPGLLQYVQSVFVEVDNTAGGAIQPTLSVKTNNGQTLAKQQQGRSISAGGVGSATWALRLADETEPPTPVTTIGAWIQRDGGGVAQNIPNAALLGQTPTGLRHNRNNWAAGITVNLAANPSTLTVTNAGLYLFVTTILWLPGNFPAAGIYTNAAKTGSLEDTGSSTARVIALQPNRVVSSGIGRCAVGDVITQGVDQNTGGPIAAPQGSLMVYRLGPNP